MADGRTHTLATRTLAVFLFSGQVVRGLYQGYSTHDIFLTSIALTVGVAGGLFLTPDLDVDAGSISEQEVRNVSPLGENLWWIYWFPYRKLIHHRSPLSHWPVIGTIGRLFYLSIPYLIVLAVSYYLSLPWFTSLKDAGLWLLESPVYRIAVLGLASSDTLHFFMDWRLFHKIFRQNHWTHPGRGWVGNTFARNR